MQHQTFVTSSYGVRVPGIIYGTAWKKEATSALVQQAIALGFRGIDTACQPKHYYPGVGIGVHAALQHGVKREELYLQSKFTSLNGQDPLQIPYDANAALAEQVEQSCQASLHNLQTNYLDCLVLHSPMADAADTLEVWRAMERLFQAGTVKQLGISNCYRLDTFVELFQNANIKPAVLQNRFYAESDYDQKLRAFCQQQQVIYQSFWTLTANPRLVKHNVTLALAKKYQRTSAQIFFRYLTQRGIIPLTGTTSRQHMQEDLAIFEFELHAEECIQMDSLF